MRLLIFMLYLWLLHQQQPVKVYCLAKATPMVQYFARALPCHIITIKITYIKNIKQELCETEYYILQVIGKYDSQLQVL